MKHTNLTMLLLAIVTCTVLSCKKEAQNLSEAGTDQNKQLAELLPEKENPAPAIQIIIPIRYLLILLA